MSLEHRNNPRYRVYLPVQIDSIELTANNISSSGMQISCPEFLLPRIQETLNKDDFNLDMTLPLLTVPCTANVKMIYNSVYGEEQLIGIKFLSLQENNQNQLSKYLQGLADNNAPLAE